MKRNMDLVREILLEIEKQYKGTVIYNFSIKDYMKEDVAVHCKVMKEAGLLSDCAIGYSDNEISMINVGNLTWEGYDYLDLIRDDTTWKKVKDTAKAKGIPLMIDTVKQIATAIVSAVTQGVVKSIMSS